MKQLVEVIAKALVDNPDEVVVTETQKDKAIIVNLKVASSDIGKVIGKSGRIAKSIRAVVSAAASNTNKKVIVEIDNSCTVNEPLCLMYKHNGLFCIYLQIENMFEIVYYICN